MMSLLTAYNEKVIEIRKIRMLTAEAIGKRIMVTCAFVSGSAQSASQNSRAAPVCAGSETAGVTCPQYVLSCVSAAKM
jgi:hypothetical protein